MNLKRQLLLVSLLTLVLPWAGCQFIRETESALRQSQQQMLSGTARAVAESLERYPEEFPAPLGANETPADQLYGHRLDTEPLVEVAWSRTRERDQFGRALDLCTGSGCVAIAFQRQRSTWAISGIPSS